MTLVDNEENVDGAVDTTVDELMMGQVSGSIRKRTGDPGDVEDPEIAKFVEAAELAETPERLRPADDP